MEALLFPALFLLGAACGSFANWAAYSLLYFEPKAVSPWMRPEAGCPKRVWSDFLPILGWIGLSREQAFRGKPYWIRPLAFELALFFLFPLLFLQVTRDAVASTASCPVVKVEQTPAETPTTADLAGAARSRFAVQAILLVLMSIATITDLDEKLISDFITVPGTLLGLTAITLFPFAQLPDAILVTNQSIEDRLAVVWAFTPFTPSAALFGKTNSSLWTAIGIYWIWCFALLNRRFRLRRGCYVAWRLFWRGMVRDRSTWFIVAPLAVIGPPMIYMVWRQDGFHWLGLCSSLYGLAIGGGLVWIIRIVAGVSLGREAMGFGDVTLMAMIGSILGWQASVIIFFLSPLAAVGAAVLNYLLHRDNEIPFGPYLCLATVALMFGWSHVWESPRSMVEVLGWILPAVFVCVLFLMAAMLLGIRLFRSLAHK